MEGPILLIGFVIFALALWVFAERYGKEWQRIVAGLIAFVAFAFLGAGILALIFISEHFSTTYRLNEVTAGMLDRTIERLEADDCDTLLADFKEMRTEVVPTYEYWTFEEPFAEFAQKKDSPSTPPSDVP